MSSNITVNTSDKELIQKIKIGDKSAFKLLFEKYHKKLLDFCLYRTGDIEASKDLVQDLFTKVWYSKNILDPEKSIQAYLYKSLTNQIINRAKHSSSKTFSLDNLLFSKPKLSEDHLDSNIDIQTAIEGLPLKLQTVFLLSRIEGFKYSEIAKICNISIKAVEKRMSKAFTLLRKSLK